ncbi:RPII140-upstream gene protein-like [Haliotis rufescens]|uniref:RPII140-upstream gene protein-like n=1 Tax=Haliotis rufescens TaxID=6454 RepID=UPI00201F7A1D|nr:RPII140-upstream gene protein-like [Haliotis rufescens]
MMESCKGLPGFVWVCPQPSVDRCHRVPRQSVWQTLSFPRVYAAEMPTATDKIEQAVSTDTIKTVNFVSEREIQEYMMKETGKDRLVKMFSKNHIGGWSPEVQFIKQVTTQTALITFLITSFVGGRHAREEFVRKHQATVFSTRFRAFRSLQDSIFMKSLLDGAKWTVKVSLFTVSLLGISQSIAVYRNKSSPWEYSIGLGITAAFLKCNLGLKGMFAGGVFGTVMGLVGGTAIWGIMYALNETQEQRNYWKVQKHLEMEKASRGLLVSPETGEQLQPQPMS